MSRVMSRVMGSVQQHKEYGNLIKVDRFG